jgi:hypothetical protein
MKLLSCTFAPLVRKMRLFRGPHTIRILEPAFERRKMSLPAFVVVRQTTAEARSLCFGSVARHRNAAAPCTSRSFHLTTTAWAPPGRWPVAMRVHPRALCDILRRLQQDFDIAQN